MSAGATRAARWRQRDPDAHRWDQQYEPMARAGTAEPVEYGHDG
jgi:hypothetical protein